MSNVNTEIKWKEIISPDNRLIRLNIAELWKYRDLLQMFVRRDISAIYKQTILGPLWFFIQPTLTTLMYMAIFTRVGKFGTAGIPPILFYLSGLVLWLYFSECILRTSSFLKDNNAIFSKVYFPRLIVPLSLVITNLVKLLIHLAMFFMVYAYYALSNPSLIRPNAAALLFPILVLLIALLGLGSGLVIASLTTRYKDLVHLITFGVQLLMFLSPVIYPLSSFSTGTLRLLILLNPLTGIIESFRYGFLGEGFFSPSLLLFDTIFIFIVLFLGIVSFNRVEKEFVDTI